MRRLRPELGVLLELACFAADFADFAGVDLSLLPPLLDDFDSLALASDFARFALSRGCGADPLSLFDDSASSCIAVALRLLPATVGLSALLALEAALVCDFSFGATIFCFFALSAALDSEFEFAVAFFDSLLPPPAGLAGVAGFVKNDDSFCCFCENFGRKRAHIAGGSRVSVIAAKETIHSCKPAQHTKRAPCGFRVSEIGQ